MNDATATFPEMATALSEIGMTSQNEADAELTAHRLQQAGWTREHAELALHRMRRRQTVLTEAQMFFQQVARWDTENLVRELTRDPPRWGVIWQLTKIVIRSRWKRMVRRGA